MIWTKCFVENDSICSCFADPAQHSLNPNSCIKLIACNSPRCVSLIDPTVHMFNVLAVAGCQLYDLCESIFLLRRFRAPHQPGTDNLAHNQRTDWQIVELSNAHGHNVEVMTTCGPMIMSLWVFTACPVSVTLRSIPARMWWWLALVFRPSIRVRGGVLPKMMIYFRNSPQGVYFKRGREWEETEVAWLLPLQARVT